MSRIALGMAEVARLIADGSRAKILSALMDDRALTALELSLAAGITPQTASSHLAKLLDANLLAVKQQGRHRYYRLASAQVARTLEAVMSLTAFARPLRMEPRVGDELQEARMCYDHIAGRVGVAVCDALISHGHIILENDAGEVTESGHRVFADLGLNLAAPTKSRRTLCRPCIDWSERRLHLAGRLGAGIADLCFERKWLVRKRGSRALTVTDVGKRMLPRAFGVDMS
jgi:DNA-binding transcriptional ArsR family regulator